KGMGKPLGEIIAENIPNHELIGNIALVANFGNGQGNAEKPSVAFSNWEIKGGKIRHQPSQSFGPICFAQYTLHNKTLKLNAQLAPVESIPGHQVSLQFKENNKWKNLQNGTVDTLGRVVQFRIEDWEYTEAI